MASPCLSNQDMDIKFLEPLNMVRRLSQTQYFRDKLSSFMQFLMCTLLVLTGSEVLTR